MAPVVLEGRLGELSAEARVYPAHLLRDGGEGLCLFAARFYGVNDAIHMARCQMALDLVDTSPRVWELEEIYGPNVMVHEGDAWAYAEEWAADERQWDAVSAELWCSLARDVVTVTHTPGAPYEVPDGWRDELFPRNDRVNWLVLTRA
jgi:hypothetical protein